MSPADKKVQKRKKEIRESIASALKNANQLEHLGMAHRALYECWRTGPRKGSHLGALVALLELEAEVVYKALEFDLDGIPEPERPPILKESPSDHRTIACWACRRDAQSNPPAGMCPLNKCRSAR